MSFYFHWKNSLLHFLLGGLVVMNDLSFVCLGKSLSLLLWRTVLPRIEVTIFSFNILKMSYHSFLAWKVSVEKSVSGLMKLPMSWLLSCCFKNYFFVFDFWKFNFNVSWYDTIQVQAVSCPFCLMDLDVYFSLCSGGFQPLLL